MVMRMKQKILYMDEFVLFDCISQMAHKKAKMASLRLGFLCVSGLLFQTLSFQ